MSIVQKLTLSLVALSFFVFGIYGAIHLHAERQDLRIAMEQETQILASSIQVSVENALRDQQIDDVQKLLQQLERIDPAIHIRVYISDNEVLHSDAEIRD
ncbi:MAG: two-component sensor histidine kinase, partial [Methylicorpusculum sp.]|nr:two-component sensor histidine kinase [Methylicorpusculum sp.]